MNRLKPINLISLRDAKNNLEPLLFERYIKLYGASLKESEYEDLQKLLNSLEQQHPTPNFLDEFYVGFQIKQISKEFDLLRFGESSIINIELKKNSTEEAIKKQHKENRYYLRFLEKKIYSFTYVANEKELYYFTEDEELQLTDIDILIEILLEQTLVDIVDIYKLFDPLRYLVSPFNSTLEFIEGSYFLTDLQRTIKREILKKVETEEEQFFVIEGSAGTGKTLLTYDLAKYFRLKDKNVLLLHTGPLNSGHRILRDEHQWSIKQPRGITSDDFSKYDFFIIDESQRLTREQTAYIINQAKETQNKCIFSFDPRQILSHTEWKARIPDYIKELSDPSIHKLKGKVRTNEELANFTRGLFDLNKIHPNQNYKNIGLSHFTKIEDAKNKMEVLREQGFTIINPTPTKYDRKFYYEIYECSGSRSTHEVIGQEYDDVACIIDWHFFYDSSKQLGMANFAELSTYHPLHMLLQMVTRARKRLHLVIINNPNILDGCLRVLQQNNSN